MILKKTVDLIDEFLKDKDILPPKVTNIVVGLGYTGVEVSTYDLEPKLGLAATLPSVITNTDCSKINFAGNLTNKSLAELLNWSYEIPSIKKIIGIATVNAVSQYILKFKNPYPKVKGDYIDYLDIDQDTNIIIIGLMKPLVRKISEKTMKIILVEDTIPNSSEFRNLKFLNNLDELENEVKSTDILFCTGTSLINNTIEKILNLFRKQSKKIIVMGPSVGMLPDILFDHGVDVVGGMEIINSEETLKILQEGGGTKLFKKFGKKYNLIKI
jgi:uncharacterized protein (DUF4213/DUF364 family)